MIDVQGKCVAPGFIDAHSHNDWFAARKDNARFFMPFLRQGITTQVTGNCGFSPFGFEKDSKYKPLLGSGLFQFPDEAGSDFSTLAGFAPALHGLPVHIVPLYGHMSGRISVSGNAGRALDEGELARLDRLIEQALDDGAAGVSLGLMYEPDRYAPYAELKRAAQIAARRGKVLTVHGRALSAVSTSYQPPVGRSCAQPARAGRNDTLSAGDRREAAIFPSDICGFQNLAHGRSGAEDDPQRALRALISCMTRTP